MNEHIDECIQYLQYILIHGTWHPSKYKKKIIFEPKKRFIYIAKFFPDRVLHHAFVDVLEERVWDKIMIYDSYSCRKDKGPHVGSRRCMEYVRKYRYCLKCDISKFYPSLDHDLIKTIIRRKLKDKKLLVMLDRIIDSFPGRKNAPIGNLTSQWYGNLYLNELDDFIKQDLRVKGYIRYCDDFILFSNDKERLKEWAEKVKKFVEENLLLTFSKFDIFPVSRGIDFLGYRHFPNGCILLRKATAKRMQKKVKAIPNQIRYGIKTNDQALSTVGSIEGWIKHANTYNLKKAMEMEKLKGEILNEQIQRIRKVAGHTT